MPKMGVSYFGQAAKLDNRSDSCEILHNRVLSRVLANKTIFIKHTRTISLICPFLKMQFYSDIAVED